MDACKFCHTLIQESEYGGMADHLQTVHPSEGGQTGTQPDVTVRSKTGQQATAYLQPPTPGRDLRARELRRKAAQRSRERNNAPAEN